MRIKANETKMNREKVRKLQADRNKKKKEKELRKYRPAAKKETKTVELQYNFCAISDCLF
jgi:hypothetical protein